MHGYARVSSDGQDNALQIDALTHAGCQAIHQEKMSGAVLARPVLQALFRQLREGDVLVVYKLDRLARSLKDLLHLLDRLRDKGVAIRSLTEPIDTSSAMGEFVLQILGAVAQLERAIIRERCSAGREAARARGVRFGRRVTVEDEHARQLAEMYQEGLSLAELGKLYGLGYSAVRGALKRQGVVLRSPGAA